MKTTFTKMCTVVTAVLMLCCMLPFQTIDAEYEIWDGSIADGFAAGTGTEANPYLIDNGAQLAYLAQRVNGGTDCNGLFFKMTNDIYLNDIKNLGNWETNPPVNEWTAIGCWDLEKLYVYFEGNFDGGGFTVFGIYINKTQNDASPALQGLFGCNKGVIINLGVEASYIHGENYVSGIVGYNEGKVVNCYNAGSITGENKVGGVVGGGGNIVNCYNVGSVIGESRVGGVVGGDGYVSNCYNIGMVKGTKYVGGIIGDGAEVSNCYNIGMIRGTENVGGVAGSSIRIFCCYNAGSLTGEIKVGGVAGYVDEYGNSNTAIENCYNTGTVTGTSLVGGIAGSSYKEVKNCYNVGNISGSETLGGIVGEKHGFVTNCCYLDTCNAGGEGAALTDAQMQKVSGFLGFDFETIWTMDGDPNYPYPELTVFFPEPTPEPTGSSETPAPEASNKPMPSSHGLNTLIIVLIILVLICIGILIIVLVKKKK